MTELRAVIFDFDFTLCDSTRAHVDCVRHALAQASLAVPTEPEILAATGSLAEAFARFAPDQSVDALVTCAQGRMDETFLRLAMLYSTVPTVVQELLARGLQLGIVSLKRAHRIDTLLCQAGLRSAFSVIVGGDDVTHTKPHPEGLNQALARLDCPPDAARYVGDHLLDLEMARAAEVPFIGVLTGGLPREAFHRAGATLILDHVGELPAYLPPGK